jgi:hypothetical protein
MTPRRWRGHHVIQGTFGSKPGWEDAAVELAVTHKDAWHQTPDATHRWYREDVDDDGVLVEEGWEYLIRCQVEENWPRTDLHSITGKTEGGSRLTVNYNLCLVVVSPNFEGDHLYFLDHDAKLEVSTEITLWFRVGQHDLTVGVFEGEEARDVPVHFRPTDEAFATALTEPSPLEVLLDLVERDVI